MFEMNMRLISMLGIITVVVLIGLIIDYFYMVRKPVRLGLGIAVLGIMLGLGLTLSAVLPENHVYGTVFSEGRPTQKVVALTFDDGPYPPYTNQILDILQEYHVPATFFMVGKNVEKHPDLVLRVQQAGHQLGNHTYNHIDLLKANRKLMEREVDYTNKAIADITGQRPHVVRPPHGFRDPMVMETMADRRLKVVEWSVMSRDWTNPGVEAIVSRTINKVQNGSVILLHDGDGIASSASRAQTVEATRQIIRELLAQGYQFVTVDEILANLEETKK
ncbi:hypothetical protein SDC9_14727 [bioreactor metagenome]|uniref:NodB homology domain-containing protein n=1 Tax=bioreactor metagenome TaxID=1076179 RepID=A0A644TPZ2_9ZZZZ|nr:polysaccharide deacetylase family protein [Negativicutes bacterium]